LTISRDDYIIPHGRLYNQRKPQIRMSFNQH
jgi:hypothetical protein